MAWALAARYPERVASLTSTSSPAFLRGLLRPRQALAAWYIAVIAVPALVEGVHARRPDVLVRLLERSGQTHAAAARDVAIDRTTLTAMLNWYRAMPFGGRDPGLVGRQRPPAPDGRARPAVGARPADLRRAARREPLAAELNVDEVAPLLLRHLAAHPARDG